MSSITSCWLALASLAILLQCAPHARAQAPVTTVFVVRHAEKLDPSDPDSPLSPVGEARAKELALKLGKAGVTRILATTRLRTQQTVAPLARQIGLDPVITEPGAVGEIVEHIRADDRGQVVLVCGHSNTLPGIIHGLSGTDVDGIPEDRYDLLFKVSIAPDGMATVEKLTYGAPTP